MLFNSYINEVLVKISQMNIGCSLGYYNVNSISYADDLVILSPTVSSLQQLLDGVSYINNEKYSQGEWNKLGWHDLLLN